MTVQTFTKSGTKASTPARLDKAIFGVPPTSYELLKNAYTAYLANGRGNSAQVKTRGLISGGGRKPWRQKGTGRARAGSSRSPIWRGGGTVFGPTGRENYSRKLHKNAKRLAVKQALSLKAKDDAVKIIESFAPDKDSTKAASGLLKKLSAKGRTLIVAGGKSDKAERAVRNLPGVETINAKYLNVYDILNADTIILDRDALDVLGEWLTPSHKASARGTSSRKVSANKGGGAK